jgi:hypothetical protein
MFLLPKVLHYITFGVPFCVLLKNLIIFQYWNLLSVTHKQNRLHLNTLYYLIGNFCIRLRLSSLVPVRIYEERVSREIHYDTTC